MKIPREKSAAVQKILRDDTLNNQQKAAMIYRHDYDMACRSQDRGVPQASMSVEQIERELEALK